MPSATRPQRPARWLRRRLADRLDRQLLDLAAKAVALDARRAGVDHVADARHRQRGLGDVGGEHDAARAVRREHLVLLLLAAGARTAAGSRRRADGACAAARRRRGSRARRAGRRARRREPPARPSPRQSSSTASTIASFESWSRLSSNGRQRISTGYRRPETWITGAGPAAPRSGWRSARHRSSPR